MHNIYFDIIYIKKPTPTCFSPYRITISGDNIKYLCIKSTFKIAVNCCVLKSCTPRSISECELYTVLCETAVNTERYEKLIILCLQGELVYADRTR